MIRPFYHDSGKGTLPILFSLILFLLFPLLSRSQSVGINTTGTAPDPSAMLDVSASDKGVLIPRVQLDDASTQAPIASAPVEGLLIYNATGTEPAGYYYWDGSQWVQVLAGNKGINSNLVLNGTTLELTDPGGTLTADLGSLVDSTDNDSVVGNEYNTGFSLSGDQLSITDPGNTFSVDLSSYDDNTDNDSVIGNEYNTSLNLNGSILELTDPGGTLTQDLSSLGGGGTDNDSVKTNELITGFALNGNLLEVSDSGGTYSVDLSSYDDNTDNDSVIGNEAINSVNLNASNELVIDEAGTVFTQDLSSLIDDADADPTNEYNTGVNLNGTTLEVTDNGGTLSQDLSSLTDSSYWTREPANGNLYPSTISDSVGIGMQKPNARLHIKGKDVDVANNTASFKIWEQKDGDSLYMDGDEISGALGGGAGNENHLFIQHETSEGVIMTTGSGAQVGVGTGANNPASEVKMDVDHQDQDIAVRGEGYYGPTRGYLGAQGQTDFDGVTTADWNGDELGVVGISVGASDNDNYGVIGHSNNWGGRFEHESSGNFAELGGNSYAIRIVDGSEASGRVLTSDASGNATWEDPSSLNDNDWDRDATNGELFPSNIGDDVGVGTNAPLSPLHVDGRVFIEGDGGAGTTNNDGSGADIDLAIEDDDSGFETPGDGKLFAMVDNDSALKMNQKTTDDYGFIFNDNGDPLDIRMESSTRDHAFYIDADKDVMFVGTDGTGFGGDDENGNTVDGLTVEYVADFDDGSATGTAIGIGSVEYLLDRSNETTINNPFSPSVDNTHSLGTSTRRWSEVYAQNGTIQTSDRRDKKNIEPLNHGLDKIMKLKPVSYQWKDKVAAIDQKGKRKIGLIAQQVKPVLDEVVKVDEDIQVSEDPVKKEVQEAERWGIYYSNIIPVLINGIQEQQKQIEDLKEENRSLKKRLLDLEERVEKLEKEE